MSERNPTEFLNLRLPLYAYTGPLWQGRRVLEIGCGDGESADYLSSHGAQSVVAVDQNLARVERARLRYGQPRIEFRVVTDPLKLTGLDQRFDIVLLPEGQAVLEIPGLIGALRGLLTDGGYLLVAVPAADRRGRAVKEGVGYYDLADALAAEFPAVRMLGQTPFLGFGLVEFDGGADALRVDVSLLQGGTELPSHYVAVAGATQPPVLGYALVQIPFAPAEAAVLGGTSGQATEGASSAVDRALIGDLDAEIEQLTRQLEAARSQDRNTGLASTAAEARATSAERRLDEVERRARARTDDADNRLNELRVKLDEAMVRAESAVRVSRVQGEEIEELRGRLRRSSEDRAVADVEMDKLRRALSQADESVLTLTRRTAEEMAVVAEKIVGRLGGGGLEIAAVGGLASADAEARTRRAEESSARDREQLAALGDRIRAADEQIRSLTQKAAAVIERDDRIARLEGDKQDLLWRVAELEEKVRTAEHELSNRRPRVDETALEPGAKDRAIEEFHRGATAHVDEVSQLQASVAEQAALVAELEDMVKTAESRAAASDKETMMLRRSAKELEESDRARRGRLAEVEGKLLRLERAKAQATAATSTDAGATDALVESALLAELSFRLQAAEQRALTAEQRAIGAEERASAVARSANGPRNGANGSGPPPAELASALEQIEERLREEMRSLTVIEETLARARAETTSAARTVEPHVNVRADLDRALAAKDSQLAEGRLELARLRRDSEARQAQLEHEITNLRNQLNPVGDLISSYDDAQGTQLVAMHATLSNIRRRSARLRDELEGFRRRLDTLPPGALSSMLEEIGEDLAEFAK